MGALILGKYFADGWEFRGTECERIRSQVCSGTKVYGFLPGTVKVRNGYEVIII